MKKSTAELSSNRRKLRAAIKKAINDYYPKWNARYVDEFEVTRSIYDEENDEGYLTITIRIKKKRLKK